MINRGSDPRSSATAGWQVKNTRKVTGTVRLARCPNNLEIIVYLVRIYRS